MLKKSLTYTVVITTIVWSVGLFALPLSVGAAVVSGDLIKLTCAAGASVSDPCKAVYYLGADSKRYVFPNEKTYKTWYSDFSGVKEVSSTEMSSYAIGGNVTYKPAAKLVKITTDPKVYAVSANGTLRWVSTADVASALYGSNWVSLVEDVADSFFVNYTVGTDIAAAADYDKAAVGTVATSINVDKGLSSAGTGVSSGTGLTVALASDTPASGIVLGNSINNKFTKVNLTASADGDIVVDTLTVRRGGVAASDTPISSVALLDESEVRIGNTKTLNSDHLAVFNQDITVKAGTTKVIYLAANMGATASYAGEVPTLDMYAMTLTGSAAVVGTLPIVGNAQTINGTITIGTLTVADGANNPTAATQKVGTTNYLLSGFKLVAGSAEDFKVTQVNFKQGGTASDEDIANLKLLVDDAQVATASAPSTGWVKFNLSASPIAVGKGKTVQIDLKADIVSGSARTIRFDLNDESDVVAKGQVYGAAVKVGDGGAGATTDAEPFWTAQITTVDRGALRVGPATLSAANIADDQDGAVLGKFEFEAKGEEVEITSLPINFAITTSSGNLGTDSTVDLTNVTLYDENGKIVAGPDDPAAPTSAYSYTTCGADNSHFTCALTATSTDTITIPVGLHIYTVKADLDSDWGANDTIIAHIAPLNITAKGSNTGLTITPTPSGEQTSATITVQGAALSVAQGSTPIASTVVGGSKGYTFASVSLGANSSGEDIKVTKVAFRVGCNASCNPAEVSNWSLYDGTTELAVSNDPDSDTSAKVSDDDEATTTFSLSTALVITKGTSKTLTLKGDINTSAANGTMNVGMSDAATSGAHITAKGATTNLDATLTFSVSDGQSMTFTSKGELTIGRDSSSPTSAALLPASSATGLTVGVFNIYSRYEKINIEKMYLTVPQVNGGGLDQIRKLYLYQGSTLIAEISPTSTDGVDATVLVDMTNTPLVIPKDASTNITLKVDTAGSDYELGSTGASGQGFAIRLTATGDITAKGDQSGAAITTLTISASTTEQYLFRSVPIITVNEDLPASGENAKIANGTLSTSLQEPLYRFKVTADSAGPVGIGQVTFQIATTTATSSNWSLYSGTTKIAATTTQVLASSDWAGTTCAAESICYGVIQFWLTNDGLAPDDDGTSNFTPLEISAGTSKYLTLKGDLECSIVSCNNPTNPSGGSVQIALLGDGSFPSVLPSPFATSDNLGGGTTGLGEGYIENSFAWTDYWRTSIQRNSSTTVSSTEAWSNGYLVPRNTIDSTSKLEATSTVVKFYK